MTPEERAEYRRVYNRAHYRTHREQRIQDAKDNYFANREARKSQRVAFRAANLDRLKAESRARYQRDRLTVLAKQSAKRATGEEKVRQHGLTLAEYHAMFARQEGLCGICGLVMARICIDHDHATGRVRGLLCHNCNVAIGHLRDSSALLRAAARYIEDGAHALAKEIAS